MVGIIKGVSENPAKIKYGMIGGGPDAFFGSVHRKAAALDGEIDLVAGAFSSSGEKSRIQGKELMLEPGRVYDSYVEMAEKEAALPEDERIDFVSILILFQLSLPTIFITLQLNYLWRLASVLSVISR